jgi:peptidoglycan/LPS O-acetylase OafA/YrhL
MISDVASNPEGPSRGGRPSSWFKGPLTPEQRSRRNTVIAMIGIALVVLGLLMVVLVPDAPGGAALGGTFAGLGVALLVVAGLGFSGDRPR